MKHRVAELEGAMLDAAVSMADGDTVVRAELGIAVLVQLPCSCSPIPCAPLNFSCNWALAGPIIERERMELAPVTKGRWVASASGTDFNEAGPTPLIAAMRAYVASKYGETVDLPD